MQSELLTKLPSSSSITSSLNDPKHVIVKTLKGERFKVDFVDADTVQEVMNKCIDIHQPAFVGTVMVCETGRVNPRLCKPRRLEIDKTMTLNQIATRMSLYMFPLTLATDFEIKNYLSNADIFLAAWAISRLQCITESPLEGLRLPLSHLQLLVCMRQRQLVHSATNGDSLVFSLSGA
jgi:hypothetical protein